MADAPFQGVTSGGQLTAVEPIYSYYYVCSSKEILVLGSKRQIEHLLRDTVFLSMLASNKMGLVDPSQNQDERRVVTCAFAKCPRAQESATRLRRIEPFECPIGDTKREPQVEPLAIVLDSSGQAPQEPEPLIGVLDNFTVS